MRILVDRVTSTGAGLVVVTHDPGVARTCERTITMRDGLDRRPSCPFGWYSEHRDGQHRATERGIKRPIADSTADRQCRNGGPLMAALHLWWRFLHRQQGIQLTIILTRTAFASATGVLLTVIGGRQALEARGGDPTYAWLARIATVMPVIPVLTLGGAAAAVRLPAR